MSEELAGESAEELIAVAAAQNFSVSKPQLARWHREDLLPRPVRRSLGRGRGMISIYPLGTRERLLALCAIHREERRLPYVGWRLWWAGGEVPVHQIRVFMEEAATEWQSAVQALAKRGQRSKLAWDYIDRAATARTDRGTLRRARKRVGSKRFSTFAALMLDAASGTFPDNTEKDDEDILLRGLGLGRARTDVVGDAQPWFQGDVVQEIRRLSKLLRSVDLPRHLKITSDSDLCQARDDLRSLFQMINAFSRMGEAILGRGAFGVGAFAQAIGTLGAADQALLLMFWLGLRSRGLGANMDTLLAVARGIQGGEVE